LEEERARYEEGRQEYGRRLTELLDVEKENRLGEAKNRGERERIEEEKEKINEEIRKCEE
jgi:hypothetical protein